MANIIGLLAILIYYFGNKYDAFKFLSSPTEIKNLVLSTGSLGIIVFIFIGSGMFIYIPDIVNALKDENKEQKLKEKETAAEKGTDK